MDDRMLKSNCLLTCSTGGLCGSMPVETSGYCENGEPVSNVLHISTRMVPHYCRQ